MKEVREALRLTLNKDVICSRCKNDIFSGSDATVVTYHSRKNGNTPKSDYYCCKRPHDFRVINAKPMNLPSYMSTLKKERYQDEY